MSSDSDSVVHDFVIGSDHAGIERKKEIKDFLSERGLSFLDVGTNSSDSVDYPDFAKAVGKKILEGKAKQGILICGTGIGMSITANKISGIRAALAVTPFMGEMGRAHNNANVLCLGARIVDFATTQQIVEAWLNASFEGGRHERRVEKMEDHP